MTYKRFSPNADTFLVIRFKPVFGKTEFFNSYGCSQQVIPSPFLIAADAPWRHCTLIEIDCLKVIPALSLACTVSRWVPVANVMSASSDFVFVV